MAELAAIIASINLLVDVLCRMYGGYTGFMFT
jgi:hypothetical protein